jgi:hypothetical protein
VLAQTEETGPIHREPRMALVNRYRVIRSRCEKAGYGYGTPHGYLPPAGMQQMIDRERKHNRHYATPGYDSEGQDLSDR